MVWVLGTSCRTPRLLSPQVLAAGPLNYLGQKLSTWQPVELCLRPACGVGLERPRTLGTPHLHLHQSSSALSRVLRVLSIRKKVLQSKQLLKSVSYGINVLVKQSGLLKSILLTFRGFDAVNSGMEKVGE